MDVFLGPALAVLEGCLIESYYTPLASLLSMPEWFLLSEHKQLYVPSLFVTCLFDLAFTLSV